MPAKTALIAGPPEDYAAAKVHLEDNLALKGTEWVPPESFKEIDRLVLLRGWEGDEYARDLAFRAVQQGVQLYEFSSPWFMHFLREDSVLARLGLTNNEPVDMETDTAAWDEPEVLIFCFMDLGTA